MNTLDFVQKYVSDYFAKAVKFLIVQIAMDFIEIAIFVFLFVKNADSSLLTYITAGVFAVVLMLTLLINVKIFFGNFKTFSKGANVYRNYNDAVTEFEKTNNQAVFDTKMEQLEKLIRENN